MHAIPPCQAGDRLRYILAECAPCGAVDTGLSRGVVTAQGSLHCPHSQPADQLAPGWKLVKPTEQDLELPLLNRDRQANDALITPTGRQPAAEM
jgi:hypothetical protein